MSLATKGYGGEFIPTKGYGGPRPDPTGVFQEIFRCVLFITRKVECFLER